VLTALREYKAPREIRVRLAQTELPGQRGILVTKEYKVLKVLLAGQPTGVERGAAHLPMRSMMPSAIWARRILQPHRAQTRFLPRLPQIGSYSLKLVPTVRLELRVLTGLKDRKEFRGWLALLVLMALLRLSPLEL